MVQAAAAFLAAGLAVVGVVRFETFCLGELGSTPDHQLGVLDRRGWVVLILVVVPLGGVLFLLYGRPR
jgi:hypothetical protein